MPFIKILAGNIMLMMFPLNWTNVTFKTLTSICFVIFDSYLSYCSFVWGHNFSTIQQILILQKKAVRFVNFQPRNLHTSPLLKECFIFKFQEKICLWNTLFVSKSLNNFTPSVFNTWFGFSSDQQNCENSSSSQGNLIKIL